MFKNLTCFLTGLLCFLTVARAGDGGNTVSLVTHARSQTSVFTRGFAFQNVHVGVGLNTLFLSPNFSIGYGLNLPMGDNPLGDRVYKGVYSAFGLDFILSTTRIQPYVGLHAGNQLLKNGEDLHKLMDWNYYVGVTYFLSRTFALDARVGYDMLDERYSTLDCKGAKGPCISLGIKKVWRVIQAP